MTGASFFNKLFIMTDTSQKKPKSLKKKLLISIIFNVTIAFTIASAFLFFVTQRLSTKFTEQATSDIGLIGSNYFRDTEDAIKRVENIYERALVHQASENWREAIAEEKAVLKKNLTLDQIDNKRITENSKKIKNEIMTEIYFILFFGLLGIFDVVWGFSQGVTDRVTIPIIKLTDVAKLIAQGNYRQKIDVKSDDEIGVLAIAFHNMIDTITKRDEELAEINRNLENLVKERTQQLNEQLTLVSDLLNNMKQAVFSVSKENKIVLPVSKFAENLFGSPIDGKDIFELVYKDMEKSSEDYSKLNSTFTLIFGGDELQWIFLENQLPKKLSVNLQGSTRTLKISYNPLWDNQEALDKLMYVIEDITDVLELERKVEAEKAQSAKNLQLLQELASIGLSEVRNFFQNSFDLLKSTEKNVQDQILVRRNLHTLKGNARALGLTRISGKIHSIESELSFDSRFPALMTQVRNSFDEYYQLAIDVFKLEQQDESTAEMLQVHRGSFEQMRALLEELQKNRAAIQIEQLNQAYHRLLCFPVKAALLRNLAMVQEVSRNLGKQVDFKVQGDPIVLDRRQIDLLNDAAGHLIRNALDHAIENPEERRAAGKSEIGNLIIDCSETHAEATRHLVIRFLDDGRGIDPNLVAQSAISKGLIHKEAVQKMSDKEKLELIFLPGFSTREQVSEVSGRGIGMEAVRSSIEQMGGTLTISSRIGLGTELRIEI